MPKNLFKKGDPKPKNSGRKKGSGYVQRCQKFMEAEGWEGLEKCARKLESLDPKSAALALEALRMLAAYGYGKPRQQLDVSGENGPVEFTLRLGQ